MCLPHKQKNGKNYIQRIKQKSKIEIRQQFNFCTSIKNKKNSEFKQCILLRGRGGHDLIYPPDILSSKYGYALVNSRDMHTLIMIIKKIYLLAL